MDNFIPAPAGMFRAVFRDPSADNGLIVQPVVGFKEPPPSGDAVVFGGPSETTFSGPPPAANPGAVGVPVVLTRRGELRSLMTAVLDHSRDPMFSAAPDIGLVDGELPAVAYLGIVQAHEDATEVFAPHVEAAAAHKAAVEAHRTSRQQPPEPPPRVVEAEVSDPARELPERPPMSYEDLGRLFRESAEMQASNNTDDTETGGYEDEWRD